MARHFSNPGPKPHRAYPRPAPAADNNKVLPVWPFVVFGVAAVVLLGAAAMLIG